MNSSAKFWVQMILFQVIFGLTILTFTRQYYLQDAAKASTPPAVTSQSSPVGPHPAVETELTQSNLAPWCDEQWGSGFPGPAG